jgi:hypothetical protein
MVLRNVLGSKRDEVTGDWRRLHNEKLYYLYPSPNIFLGDPIKKEIGGACCAYG